MHKIISFTVLALLFITCKKGVSNDTSKTPTIPTHEAIAKAYGIDHWNAVNEIRFTFNVDRGDFHTERRFHWNPKTDAIVYIANGDTLNYTRGSQMDSLQTAADQRFINDKYWLLVPFQLVWDPNLDFTEQNNVVAPISKDTLSKLTFVYPSEGGYTPGDAYDLYYNEEYLVQEWSYRRGNQPEPNLTMTWEDLEKHKGLFLTTMHRDSLNDLQIRFTDLYVE